MSGGGTEAPPSAHKPAPRFRLARLVGGGVLIALVLAGVVSNIASGSPDGLDSVVREGCAFDSNDEIVSGQCAAQNVTEHGLDESPLANYGVSGVNNSFLSTGLAGVLGVLVTLGVGVGLFAILRAKNRGNEASDDDG